MSNDTINTGNTVNIKRPAIVSILSFSLLVICIPAFALSPFCRMHPGLVLVLLGVLGEVIDLISDVIWEEQSRKLKRVLKTWGIIFWAVVVFGLLWEFRDAANSDIEVKQLQSDIETTRSNNLVLQARVLELQAQAGPRIITDIQIANFMALTKDYPKMPIEIFVGAIDNETLRFAREIKDMLKQAGYGSTNGDIMHMSPAISGFTETSKMVNLSQFVVFPIIGGHTNGEFLYAPLAWDQKIGTTLSIPRITAAMTKTNTPELKNAIFICAIWAFNQIGLTNRLDLDNVEFKTNEFAIVVPLKNH